MAVVNLWALIKTKGTEALTKAWMESERLNQSLAQTGAASGVMDRNMKGAAKATSNTTKEFSKMAQGLGGMVHVYATIAANVFAVSSAFNVLRDAAKAEQLTQSMVAFQVATGTAAKSIVGDLKKITDGAISSQQAMVAVAQGTASGFSSTQIKDITKVASNVSKVLGRDTGDSIDRLMRGITKLEPELIDELGLMTRVDEANRAYARSVGKSVTSLTSFEKRMAFANAVLEEGRVKYDELGQIVDANPYDRIAASAANAAKQILNVFGKPVAAALELITDNVALLTAAVAGLGIYFGKKLFPDFAGSAREAAAAAEETAERFRQTAARVTASSYANLLNSNGFSAEVDKMQAKVDKFRKASDAAITSLMTKSYSFAKQFNSALANESVSEMRAVQEMNRAKAAENRAIITQPTTSKARKDALIAENKTLSEANKILRERMRLEERIADVEQRRVQEAITADRAAQRARDNVQKAEIQDRRKGLAANILQSGASIGLGAGVSALIVGYGKEIRESFDDAAAASEGAKGKIRGAIAGITAFFSAGATGGKLFFQQLAKLFVVMAEATAIIGIIVAAIGLLAIGFTWAAKKVGLFSKEMEQADEANKTVKESFAEVSKQVEKYNRLLNSGFTIEAIQQRATALETSNSAVIEFYSNTIEALKKLKEDAESQGWYDWLIPDKLYSMQGEKHLKNLFTNAARQATQLAASGDTQRAKDYVAAFNKAYKESKPEGFAVSEPLVFDEGTNKVTTNIDNIARKVRESRSVYGQPVAVSAIGTPEEIATAARAAATALETAQATTITPVLERAEAYKILADSAKAAERNIQESVKSAVSNAPGGQALNDIREMKTAYSELGQSVEEMTNPDAIAHAEMLGKTLSDAYLATIPDSAAVSKVRALRDELEGMRRDALKKAAPGESPEQTRKRLESTKEYIKLSRDFALAYEQALDTSEKSTTRLVLQSGEYEQSLVNTEARLERLNRQDSELLATSIAIAKEEQNKLGIQVAQLRLTKEELGVKLRAAQSSTDSSAIDLYNQQLAKADADIALLQERQNTLQRTINLGALQRLDTEEKIREYLKNSTEYTEELYTTLNLILTTKQAILALDKQQTTAELTRLNAAIDYREKTKGDFFENKIKPEELVQRQSLEVQLIKDDQKAELTELVFKYNDFLDRFKKDAGTVDYNQKKIQLEAEIMLAVQKGNLELEAKNISDRADLEALILENIKYQNKFPPTLQTASESAAQIWWQIGQNFQEDIDSSMGFVDGAARAFGNVIDATVDNLVDQIVAGTMDLKELVDSVRQVASDSLAEMAKDVMKTGIRKVIVSGIEKTNPALAKYVQTDAQQTTSAVTAANAAITASVDKTTEAVNASTNAITAAIAQYSCSNVGAYAPSSSMPTATDEDATAAMLDEMIETKRNTAIQIDSLGSLWTEIKKGNSEAKLGTATLGNIFTSGLMSIGTALLSSGGDKSQAVASSILGIAGSVLGGMYGGPMGATAGGQLGAMLGGFFENGGVMSSKGRVNTYSTGGVADTPQVAIYGEGRMPEAYVPLPDGKTIPVTMNSDNSAAGMNNNISISVNVDNNGNSETKMDAEGAGNMAKGMSLAISAAIKQEIMKQKQPGGMLSRSR